MELYKSKSGIQREETNYENFFYENVTNWINENIPHKTVTTTILKKFCADLSEPIATKNCRETKIATFEDLAFIIESSERWDVLVFILEQNCVLCEKLSNKQKIEMIKFLDNNHLNTLFILIRWGDCNFLDVFLNMHNFDLKEIACSLEETVLKGIPIATQMKNKIEGIIFNERFLIEKTTEKKIPIKSEIRIGIILNLIKEMKEQDNLDLFKIRLRWISENIHVLKGGLKKPHSALPWYEIEFILADIICQKEIGSAERNIIVGYLNSLKRALENLEDYSDDFIQLKDDFEMRKTFNCLLRMTNYMEIVACMDFKNCAKSRLAIERCIQVVGECLKRTRMSPNLSVALETDFERVAPNFLQQIRILRDCLSHTVSLQKRIDIDPNVFPELIKELKSAHVVIVNILYIQKFIIYENRMKCINDDCYRKRIIVAKNRTDENYSDGYLSMELLESFLAHSNDEILKKMLIKHFCKNIKNIDLHDSVDIVFILAKNLHKISELEAILLGHSKQTIRSIQKIFNIFLKNHQLDFEKYYNLLKNQKQQRFDELYWIENFDNVMKQISEKMPDPDAFLNQYQVCKEKSKGIDDLVNKINNKNIGDSFEHFQKNYNLKLKMPVDKKGWRKIIVLLKDSDFYKISLMKLIKSTDGEAFPIYKKFLDKLYPDFGSAKIFSDFFQGNINKFFSARMLDLKEILESNDGKEKSAALEMCVLDLLEIYNSKDMLLEDLTPFDLYYPMINGLPFRNHIAHYNIIMQQLPNSIYNLADIFLDPIMLEKLTSGNYKIGNAHNLTAEELKQRYAKCVIIISTQNFFDNNITALKSAIISNKIENFTLLLNTTSANLLENVEKFLQLSIKHDSHGVFDFLIEKFPIYLSQKFSNDFTILQYAALNDCPKICKIIFRKSFDANLKGFNEMTALHLSALLNKTEFIQELLKCDSEINLEAIDRVGNTALHLACLMGHKDVAEILTKNNAKIDAKGNFGKTPLILSVENRQVEIVEYLLLKNANPHLQDDDGQTSLHSVAKLGHTEICEKILQKFENFAIDNKRGNIAIEEAVIADNHKILEMIKFDVNYQNPNGRFLIHLAAENGSLGVVEYLIKIGCNLYSANEYKQSALHIASIHGNEDIVNLLIKNNFEIGLCDAFGKTAVNYSFQFKHRNVHDLLFNSVLKNEINNQLILPESGGNLLADKNFNEVKTMLSNINVPLNANLSEMLIASILCNNFVKAKELIEAGADVKTKISKYQHNLLHISSTGACSQIVALLLENKIDPNEINTRGESSLHFAVRNFEAMELLIKFGGKIETKANDGFNVLHKAARSGNENVIKLLLQQKPDCNARDNEGCSALHLAASSRNEKIVEILLKTCDNNSVDKYASTVLHKAASNTNEKVLEMLLQKGFNNINDKNKYGFTALHKAASNGNEKIAKLLLATFHIDSFNINDTASGTTLLHKAAANTNEKVIELLLKAGIKNITIQNNYGFTALHEAALNINEKIIQQLIKLENIDPDVKDESGSTIFHKAVANANEKIIETLLMQLKSFDINAKDGRGNTVLHKALLNANIKIVEMLLKTGKCDINTINANQSTLLHEAALNTNENILKTLLIGNKFNDFNAKDKYNSTPLHKAASNENEKVIELLLVNGANDFIAQDSNGATVLHKAASNRNVNIVKLLLENGAVDNNTRDNDGYTVLHKSVINEIVDVTEALLKSGVVDIDAKDNLGYSAMHLAVALEYENIAKLLLEYGAADVNRSKFSDGSKVVVQYFVKSGTEKD